MAGFKFKQFEIHQDRCAMKVGTDGVLLGAWAPGGKRILDIGSGTGLISLMMAQRCQEAQVIGVDLDAEACEEACENVAASPFADRVSIVCCRLQDYESAEKFDAILKRMTASSRMKDFYDIYYWSQVFDFEGRVLQEAISETLQHRGTPYEKDSMEQIRAFDQNEFLQKLWNNYNPGPGLEKPDFSSVLVQINRFISPVYGALLREDEFFGMWSSKENVWK